MKIKELMIGNWVIAPTPEYELKEIQVEQIKEYAIMDKYYNTSFIEELAPIPITEDFLIKNGFNKQCIFESIIECYEGIYEWEKEVDGYFVSFRNYANHKDCDWCVHIDNCDRDSICNIDIQYVHQLQNVLNILGIEMEVIV